MKRFPAYVMFTLGCLLAACNNNNNNNNNNDTGSISSNEEAGTDALAASSASGSTGGASGSSGGASDTGAGETGSSSGGGEAEEAGPQAAVLSDEQIVGIVIAANTGEIKVADLALGVSLDGQTFGLDAGDIEVDAYVAQDSGTARYGSALVGQYAQMMADEQTASNVAVVQFGIPSQTSTLKATLQSTNGTTLAQLSELSGGAFDVAYMESQVAAHKALRDLIRGQLIPAAMDGPLKTTLQNVVLPTVESHLASATAILVELTEGGSGDAASE